MESFTQNSLSHGEKIESEAMISWFSQSQYFFCAVLSLFFAVIFLFSDSREKFGLFLLLVFCSLILIVRAISNVVTTELAVTNKRVIGTVGVFRRVSIDIPLARLESISINQDIIGRVFGFGSLSIHGIGGNNVTVSHIKSPLSFRRVVMNLLDNKAS
jgi:uncharacterized membrane protein YdbT with pleckstrin-like domain